jgi:hypothetical protein
MTTFHEMPGGMLIFRIIAAIYFTATLADTQMYPAVACGNAFITLVFISFNQGHTH